MTAVRAAWFVVASLLASSLAAPAVVQARVERFALIVGNDRGLSDEVELRYAELDARKVHATLRDIGGFSPVNMVLLEGSDATTLRRTLIDLNVRLRSARSDPETEIVLFVYYSGHADVEDLHLGSSRLSVAEFSQLVRGSAADFRLLVLDACRSGVVVTRTKGGRPTQPFDIPHELGLGGEGLAFLTASAENEFAQESDELHGSFFTHAFVSGLLGAAERDRDGNVLLDEAYQYAYDSTLRASSRSASGLQHPTFFYDLRGQGRLVLAQPFAKRENRGVLELPSAATYLVFRDSPDGEVLAEVSSEDRARSLSLAPGRYFVRGRTATHVLEGSTHVEPARTTHVNVGALTRIEYAQLVRKGHVQLPYAHAVELSGYVRAALPNADSGCWGGSGAYRMDLPDFAWMVRAGFCSSTLSTSVVSARTHEYTLGVRGLRTFDLSSRFALDTGIGLAAVHFEQHFESTRRAPTRRTWTTYAELVLGLTYELTAGTYAALNLSVQAYALPVFDAKTRSDTLEAAFTWYGALGAGARF